MTTLFATRAARRRAVTFTILLSVSLILMAISSSPGVTEFQNAMAYALRPIQGALHDVAATVSNAVGAIGEIQGLHSDNTALRRENERLTADTLRAIVERADGSQVVVAKVAGKAVDVDGAWRTASISLDAFAGTTIRLRFIAEDGGPGHLLEVELDDIRVTQPS